MFNPWKHLRLAGALITLGSMFIPGDEKLTGLNLALLGLALVAIGVVGGLDLTERRVELLELKEKTNETEDR